VYESGCVHPQNVPDHAFAFKYFSQAARKGYAKAQEKLAKSYAMDIDAINQSHGLQWFETAEAARNDDAP
jgi:TPR repeat protein